MPSLSRVRRCQPLLGTYVILTAEDPRTETELHPVLDAAFAAISKVAALMSFHDPSSDLSRLNSTAWHQPQPVHAWTWQVLQAALSIARESGGAFDPTVAPRLEKWGFLPRLASRAESGGSFRDIELLPGNLVRFHRPLHVDLGGIAKGFAVDQAIAVFEEQEVGCASANAGGDLRLHGTAAAAPPMLQVRDPRSPIRDFLTLPMLGPAVATSAAYFASKRHLFRRVCPLVQPEDGRPLSGRGSVTVFAPTALLADALTKVVLFNHPDSWPMVLAKHQARAILITAAGKILPSQPSLP